MTKRTPMNSRSTSAAEKKLREQAFIAYCNLQPWLTGLDPATELQQATEEGRDLSSVKTQLKKLIAVPLPGQAWNEKFGGKRGIKWMNAVAPLIDKVQTLRYLKNYPYDEPSDISRILKALPTAIKLPVWKGNDRQFLHQLHGGLLGRICGCLLGKPVEGFLRQDIRLWGQTTLDWPLTNYFKLPTEAQKKAMKDAGAKARPGESHLGCLRGRITGFPGDDDINYTTLGFVIVKDLGKDFTPMQVAAYWGGALPIFQTCTAERVAYRNIVNGVLPPYSAVHRNPYREWIGAQIRADYFGFANPGNPARAAEWAWRDASVSHIKNGIYGEMWVAAMLAAAYVTRDMEQVIRVGLTQIPARSRFHEAIEQVLTAWKSGGTYEHMVERIHTRWDEANIHHWCHAISNAQLVALSLLYGEGDFEKTITRAVMAGMDTDCNGATAGAIWGVMHGVDALPSKWTSPLKDRVRTAVADYQDMSISQLASEMRDTAITNR